jgi:hypothetical protein
MPIVISDGKLISETPGVLSAPLDHLWRPQGFFEGRFPYESIGASSDFEWDADERGKTRISFCLAGSNLGSAPRLRSGQASISSHDFMCERRWRNFKSFRVRPRSSASHKNDLSSNDGH